MQIWLVRHASTRALEEERIQGLLDCPLSMKGRNEAGRLAIRIKDENISVALCSPLKRARETAEIIVKDRELKIKFLPLISEYSWGIFEGLTWDEIALIFPDYFKKLQNNYWHAYIPGRESRRRFLLRIRATKRHICSRYHPKEIILLVTHGRFINAFITYMTGRDLDKKWNYSPKPASVSVLEGLPSNGNFFLKIFNDCNHLIK